MTDALKGALKSKTVWFNLASAALEITNMIAPVIPPGTWTLVVNAVNIGLRFLTTQALADK